ncbi:MAG: hypothetical protein QOF47_1109, partial [Mycobacterium sp.]|nr:hypothetical protein [Mycobacterium sp.]
DPHVSQNRARSCGTAPQDRHTCAAGVTASSAGPVALTDIAIRQAYCGSHPPMGISDDIDARDTDVRPIARWPGSCDHALLQFRVGEELLSRNIAPLLMPFPEGHGRVVRLTACRLVRGSRASQGPRLSRPRPTRAKLQ